MYYFLISATQLDKVYPYFTNEENENQRLVVTCLKYITSILHSQNWNSSLSYSVCVSCSVVSQLFATPWTLAHQSALYTEFSRQEYWSGLPFPSPGDLPDPGIKPGFSALQAYSLQSEPPGKPILFQSPASISYYVIALGRYDFVVIRKGGKTCVFYKHSFTSDLRSMPCEVRNYHWDNSHMYLSVHVFCTLL